MVLTNEASACAYFTTCFLEKLGYLNEGYGSMSQNESQDPSTEVSVETHALLQILLHISLPSLPSDEIHSLPTSQDEKSLRVQLVHRTSPVVKLLRHLVETLPALFVVYNAPGLISSMAEVMRKLKQDYDAENGMSETFVLFIGRNEGSVIWLLPRLLYLLTLGVANQDIKEDALATIENILSIFHQMESMYFDACFYDIIGCLDRNFILKSDIV